MKVPGLVFAQPTKKSVGADGSPSSTQSASVSAAGRSEGAIAGSGEDDESGAVGSNSDATLSREICALSNIRIKAEEIKKAITYADSVEFSCVVPAPFRSRDYAKNGGGAEVVVRFEVQRERDFELGCKVGGVVVCC